MTRWRPPSLGYRAFDEVLLTLAALWASKRSQVLAPHARLDNRQSHGRTASGAQWPLVLFVEHSLPLMLGGKRPFTIRGSSWRSQPGRHPFHRMGLGDDLIDVIAIDALKHAPLVSDTRGLDVCQDHWA